MSKVHITLVGGQNMPVYLGIKYASPDTTVFICSKDSKDKVAPIKKLMPNLNTTTRILDPSDLKEISICVQHYLEEYANDKVTINISSGTKPWAYFFINEFAKHPNASIFFIDQNSIVHDFATFEATQLCISIDEQLTLTNSVLERHGCMEDYSDADYAEMEDIRSLRESSYRFSKLVGMMADRADLTKVELKDGSSLEWFKEEQKFVMKAAGDGRSHIFSSPHTKHLVLNAGWFEIWVAKMLSTWDNCKELWTNCVFQIDATISNEIDIIANLGNKLLFVECKTQLKRPSDIDKFNSVVKKCGGNGSKALFITYEPMDKSIRETCDRYGIIPFSFKSKGSPKIKPSSSLITVLSQNVLKNNI